MSPTASLTPLSDLWQSHLDSALGSRATNLAKSHEFIEAREEYERAFASLTPLGDRFLRLARGEATPETKAHSPSRRGTWRERKPPGNRIPVKRPTGE